MTTSQSIPTPATVALTTGLQRQRRQMAAKGNRSRNARRNGYRGPLTRAEMAAKAARINSGRR